LTRDFCAAAFSKFFIFKDVSCCASTELAPCKLALIWSAGLSATSGFHLALIIKALKLFRSLCYSQSKMKNGQHAAPRNYRTPEQLEACRLGSGEGQQQNEFALVI
jgi:hypothetical protein